MLEPYLDIERSRDLAGRAYIIPLTFGRARIVIDEPRPVFYRQGASPLEMLAETRESIFYEKEFW